MAKSYRTEVLAIIAILLYSITMNQGELFYEFDEHEKNELYAPQDLNELYELSVDAYYAALYARMSCLPVNQEVARFIDKVKNAALRFANSRTGTERNAAKRAATDRSDGDVIAVLNAARKVWHEIHRLTGLLRFSLEQNGRYTARCAPDHFILPALAEHFTLRFGKTPWAIIDEKRGLCLSREDGGPARLSEWSLVTASEETQKDIWEDLWRLYHRSINNEARKNPDLQRQFMPERYHKYLTEMSV